MFGHQDDKKDSDENKHEEVVAPDTAATAAADAPADDAQTPASAAESDAPAADSPAPAADGPEAEEPAGEAAGGTVSDDNAWQHPGAPLSEDDKDEPSAATEPAAEPEDDDDEDDDEDAKGPEPINDIVGTSAGPDFKPFPAPGGDEPRVDHTPHDLIDIKQKALSDLTPLVSQLDQEPEDKFRTIMMMVQAGDDQSLLKTAYEAAHEIKDEKIRAQALLDVVNEINYFTQHPQN